MRKKVFILLTVLSGLVISFTACRLGEDIVTLEKNATLENVGITVDIPDILGVTAPMNYGIPVKSITENDQYTGTVSWSLNNRSLTENERFSFGNQYTATITLTPKNKYTLHMVEADFFTVAGATSTVNNKNSGIIKAVFPSAVAGIVNMEPVPLAVPTAGGTPVTTISNEMYTGTVTWSPAVTGTFTIGTQYTATVTLTAKTGYTLQGVGANSFTVNGATSVSNAANSGVITVRFPQTGAGITTNMIEYYWVDQHGSLVTTSGGTTSILSGSTLTIQPQNATGYSVQKWYVNGVDTGQNGDSYIFSIATIGKHSVDLFLTKDGKLYSTSITIEVLTNALTANTWTNGNITTTTREQWFKFTATSSSHYIHVNVGTLTNLYVQVYGPTGTVGTQATYSSSVKSNSWSLTSQTTYYIKVTPNNTTSTGTFQIAFNTLSTPPLTLPTNATELTAGTWTDGSITASTGEQWFKFTATASSQYIHVNFGTLTSLYVQLYNTDSVTVGTQASISTGSDNKYISRTVTSGNTYYIHVTPYSTGGAGTYKITFNTSSTPSLLLPSDVPTLTAGTWSSGSITASTGEQWFKFTATAASGQYIHVSFGTFSSSNGLYVQIYNPTGATVGSQTRLYGSNTYTSSFSLTSGQTYYIKVTPYISGNTGTYQITFNTSYNPPSGSGSGSGNGSESNPYQLSNGSWSTGSITGSTAVWYSFSVTSGTTYRVWCDDSDNSSYTADVKVAAYYGNASNSIFDRDTNSEYFTATQTGTVKLKVYPLASGNTGTFRIVYSTGSSKP